MASWRVIARLAFCIGQGAAVSEYVNPAGPKLRNSVAFLAQAARKPRASKQMHLGEVRKGTPEQMNHFLGKKARKIAEEFVHTTEEKRPTTHCSEGKAKESKERCHVP